MPTAEGAARGAPAGEFHGLAPALAERLRKLGLRGLDDLVLHLPLRYEDETRVFAIAEAPHGEFTQVEGTVVDADVKYRPRRQLVARVCDASGELVVRLIHFYPNQQRQLLPGAPVRLAGEIRAGFFGAEMVHPRIRAVRGGEALPERLTPVYPTTAGLSQAALRQAVARALATCDLSDPLPPALVKRLGLPSCEAAVRLLHDPPPDVRLDALEQRTHPAWQRVKFDELLAQQLSMRMHRRSRDAARAEPLGVEVAWLSGSQGAKARREALAAVEQGRAALAVGTHALFQESVSFSRLALAIVDEQHRFGVHQRLALRLKGAGGDALPHQLMMSATPIPRTLAMSFYADLDVSVIDALPPGRKPVVTKVVSDERREAVLARVREACEAGGQAYWVCPLIEESEQLQLKTALDTHAVLAEALPGLEVGLVHGRLSPAEKAAVMAQFQAGRVQVLVATTVIEVGVDVPNAALMVIEHAERIGLSQLHQLRGRVGRGSAESACVLLYQKPLGATARERLRIIHENSDGFEIAREDLRLRGPGELLGARQSGVPMLRFADLVADAALLETARAAAAWLLEHHEPAARAHVERWLGGRDALLRV